MKFSEMLQFAINAQIAHYPLARHLPLRYDAGMPRSSTNSARSPSPSTQREKQKPIDIEDRFWEGFEEEVQAYLARYPQEQQERDRFAGTSADHLTREP